MFNRRFLRIRVLQILYGYFRGNGQDVNSSERSLRRSLERFIVLAHYLLLLPPALAQEAEGRIERAKKKFRPTPQDLNPNRRMVDNPLILKLAENKPLNQFAARHGRPWGASENALVPNLLDNLMQTDFYKAYMDQDVASMSDSQIYRADRHFLATLTDWLCDEDALLNELQRADIYWSTDMLFAPDAAIFAIQRTLPTATNDTPLLDEKIEQKHIDFASQLLRLIVLHHKENLMIIDEVTQHWEIERIAALDRLILEMGITEAIYFKDIPVKVSINECVEIGRLMSTPQSASFINGVIDRVFETLKNQGRIEKFIAT